MTAPAAASFSPLVQLPADMPTRYRRTTTCSTESRSLSGKARQTSLPHDSLRWQPPLAHVDLAMRRVKRCQRVRRAAGDAAFGKHGVVVRERCLLRPLDGHLAVGGADQAAPRRRRYERHADHDGVRGSPVTVVTPKPADARPPVLARLLGLVPDGSRRGLMAGCRHRMIGPR